MRGTVGLLSYILFLYQLWHLCQYGGLRSHLPILIISVVICLLVLILCLVSKKHKTEEHFANIRTKKLFYIELILLSVVTAYFGGRIIYSAIPYHGALSWKIDEWMRKKEVKLEHNNFFTDGAAGVLVDLDHALNLPKELYIVEKFQMTFDENGTIQTIYTFLYGRDRNGETKTYLVDYDMGKSKDMTVWMNGEANEDYDEDMRLDPMLRILQRADCEKKVEGWAEGKDADRYEILYLGRRSFQTKEGLTYLPGDADGDGAETGISNFECLNKGGEIIGYEVSLHIPASEDMTPVRYMMEPEYVSQGELDEEREEQQTAEAKGAQDAEIWTVDQTDETMYFFLDDYTGWRLTVMDAAAGSRFYAMEKTEDGGSVWKRVNEDPFDGAGGAAEGLVFYDENFGFAGVAGASQSHSQLYVTRDGGVTFEKIQLPMDTVTELPRLAAERGFTAEDYDYFHMPENRNGMLTIQAVTEAGESEGILFQSQDNGESWEYAGITP